MDDIQVRPERGRSSSSSSRKNMFKTVIFKASQNSRHCCNGSKCQAHPIQRRANHYLVAQNHHLHAHIHEYGHTLVANSDNMGEWSPLDDNIEVVLPCGSLNNPPSRQQLHGYVSRILYGSHTERRLPAFVELCSEQPNK